LLQGKKGPVAEIVLQRKHSKRANQLGSWVKEEMKIERSRAKMRIECATGRGGTGTQNEET